MNHNDDNPYRSPVDPQALAAAAWLPPDIDVSRAIPMSGMFTWADCRRASRLIIPNRMLVCAGLIMGGLGVGVNGIAFFTHPYSMDLPLVVLLNVLVALVLI